MLKAHERRKLQTMINRTAAAYTVFYHRQAELNRWCQEHYGAEPGEIDADSIIDAVLGGSGAAPGMTAEEFDEIMREGTGNVD